jgi:hypothetical protein
MLLFLYLNYGTVLIIQTLSFVDCPDTTIINDSSTLHVQIDLLEVQFYYMFQLVEPSSGNTYQQQFLKLLNCIECEYIL